MFRRKHFLFRSAWVKSKMLHSTGVISEFGTGLIQLIRILANSSEVSVQILSVAVPADIAGSARSSFVSLENRC